MCKGKKQRCRSSIRDPGTPKKFCYRFSVTLEVVHHNFRLHYFHPGHNELICTCQSINLWIIACFMFHWDTDWSKTRKFVISVFLSRYPNPNSRITNLNFSTDESNNSVLFVRDFRKIFVMFANMGFLIRPQCQKV